MERLDLFDPDLAEPIYFYVQEHFEDYRSRCALEDLSRLEYVLYYAYDDFVSWLALHR